MTQNSAQYEKGFEDGLRDGYADAAGVALPALRAALATLPPGEASTLVAAALAELKSTAPDIFEH